MAGAAGAAGVARAAANICLPRETSSCVFCPLLPFSVLLRFYHCHGLPLPLLVHPNYFRLTIAGCSQSGSPSSASALSADANAHSRAGRIRRTSNVTTTTFAMTRTQLLSLSCLSACVSLIPKLYLHVGRTHILPACLPACLVEPASVDTVDTYGKKPSFSAALLKFKRRQACARPYNLSFPFLPSQPRHARSDREGEERREERENTDYDGRPACVFAVAVESNVFCHSAIMNMIDCPHDYSSTAPLLL